MLRGAFRCFYSDGLVEAHEHKREMCGVTRLQGWRCAPYDEAAMVELPLSGVALYRREWEQEDDTP